VSEACAELVARCFHARTNAHFQHLSTHSFAAHKALEEFYLSIVERADAFAEAYQGRYGLIADYSGLNFKLETDPEKMLTELRTWVGAHRYECGSGSDTELQNLIDEIVALIDSTVYKLRFLK
jgi:uncharacterized protein DUF5856